MDDEDFGGAGNGNGGYGQPQNRNGEFATGLRAAQAQLSPGLEQQAQKSEAMVPRAIGPSATTNGRSASTFQSTLGGQFPTANGTAENMYETAKFVPGAVL